MNIYKKSDLTKSVSIPLEKSIESDSKLRIEFMPLEPVEHQIDITDNGSSIEGLKFTTLV